MTTNMKPDSSPNTLAPKPAAGRRLNQVPAMMLGAVVLAVVLVLATVVRARAVQQTQSPGSVTPALLQSPQPDVVIPALANPKSPGLIPAQSGTSPGGSTLFIAQVDDPDQPPTPPRLQGGDLPTLQGGEAPTWSPTTSQSASDRPDSQEREELRRQRHEQMMAAMNAPMSVDSSQSGASLAVNTQVSAQVIAQPDIAALEKSLTALTQPAQQPTRQGYEQFDKQTDGDRFALNSRVQAPRSPYELRAGFVLPATMITGINSELPGTILAQISQNVYDSATGKYLLVPQGARLYGSYSSDVNFGQGRVLVAWQRIVFPDGKAMDIGAMPGADAAGMSGLADRTNNHYVRIYANAFLLSGITGAITYSQRRNENGSSESRDAGSALSEALGAQLGQVTAQLIAKNINIAPTLEVRPGYRFSVVVTKDLDFLKPYQAFDYR